MSDDEEREPSEEPTDGWGFDPVFQRLATLRQALRGLVEQSEERREWFAMWLPVVGSLARLGTTLAELGLRLKQYVAYGEDDPLDDEIKTRLIDDARAIRDDFPDVAALFFGVHNIDDLIEALSDDETASHAARSLLDTVVAMADRIISTMIDVALGNAETSFGPERVMEVLNRYEALAQRMLDRWLLPALEGNPED